MTTSDNQLVTTTMATRSFTSTSSTGKSDLSEGQFEVEKVVKRRIGAGGGYEYYLKWKGFGEEDNTWEPEKNLTPDLIAQFNKQEAEKAKAKNKKTDPKWNGSESDGEPPEVPGFARGLVADEIIGTTQRNGENFYLIKWTTDPVNEPELVPASVANVQCPQVVIAFYEMNLCWAPLGTSSGEKSDI
ncbi:Chromobox protein 1 [Orchesella cincta]|uniref:Chromobox protein 1 n=1 Tax=Orchesella cincta TaxID=48709 RepID=A0A1D2N163_ORCCI|nr:Chromobox protein 1 [Orchesella cincta]